MQNALASKTRKKKKVEKIEKSKNRKKTNTAYNVIYMILKLF